MYDLPSEYPEELGLPDEFHDFQPQLLRETCKLPNHDQNNIFIGTDLNIYYDSRHPQWHKRPDWFLALGVPKATQQEDLRWSYVIWQEGVSPFLVIELLSPGTEDEDLGRAPRRIDQPPGKWDVYEHLLRVPYYVVFDRYENGFRLFKLMGIRYEEEPIGDNRYWFEDLGLGLGLWQGSFQEATGIWLRWYDTDGRWLATSAELAEQEKQRAEQEKQRAEQEKQRAEQEKQRADKLAARLRELGINPEEI